MIQYKEPIQIVTITIDYCDLNFGVGSCTAALSSTQPHKCFNTYHTCPVRDVFQKGTLDIKFCTPVAKLPIDGNTYFPYIKSVSASSSTVNLAGSNPKYGNLGKRGRLSVVLDDAPSNDAYTDKYALGRVDGTAQYSGVGYPPEKYGQMIGKLKARFPNFVNRPIKYEEGYIVDGVIQIERTRHFIWTTFDGPSSNSYTIGGKDVLSLLEEDKALAPATSKGYLSADIDTAATSITLTPTGIGDSEYPSSGYVNIGSEVMAFTRSGDVLTVTRASYKTEVASHSEGDVVQLCLEYINQYPHTIGYDLITNYSNADASHIDLPAWAAETNKWATTLRLSTLITEPTGVGALLAEMAPLGITFWWDDVEQKIGYDINSPPDTDPVAYSDDDFKEASSTENDEDRLTTIIFYAKQSDVTGSVEDGSNYDTSYVLTDADASLENYFGDVKIRKVYCRWLNGVANADTIVGIASRRLLNRFNTAPRIYRLTFDIDERDNVNLVDVISVTSDVTTTVTGLPDTVLAQIISVEESGRRSEIQVEAQRFLYEGNFAYVMENGSASYNSYTGDKNRKAFLIAEGDDFFDDGGKPYLII